MTDWLDKLEQSRLKPRTFEALEVISSSYAEIDKALGVGGFPVNKTIEIAGRAGVGKSTLMLDILASAQNGGKKCLFFDVDRTFDKHWAKIREIDLNSLLVYQPPIDQVDNVLSALEKLAEAGKYEVLFIDTISGYTGLIGELLAGLTRIQSKYKITVFMTSQIRENYHDPRDYKTPYMSILNSYSNIRIMLSKIESIKTSSRILIGKKINVNIYKNCVNHPTSTEIELYL